MQEPAESSNVNRLPNKGKFAQTFRLLSRISYWIQLILGIVSGLIVLLVSFSRSATEGGGTTGTGIGN